MASNSTHRNPIRAALYAISPSALLATSVVLLLPGNAGAQAIFNQTSACGTETMPSQVYTDLGGEVMAADDFVVPGGQSWTLDRIAVFGALAEINPSNPTYDVTIYNNAGTVPDTPACLYTGLTSNTVTVAPGIEAGFQFDLPTVCNLTAGTYWLEVQAVLPSTDGVFGWQTRITANGNAFVWQDPNNIFGTGCTTWTTHTLCGPFGGSNPDLCLALFEEGAILDLAPPFLTLELDPVHLDPLANGTLTAEASETQTGGATVVSIEYQIDSGSWMPMTAFDGAYDSNDEFGIETVSFADEGVHQACARATDGLGNTSPPICIDIGVGAAGDITGPSTAISFGPIPIRALEEGALTATSSEENTGGANIADIEYQLDGGSWLSMEPLDDAYDSVLEVGFERPSFATVGMHEACVRGIDTRGNTGEELCIDIEVIETDSEAPPPPIIDVQPNPVTDGDATLSVTASDTTTGNSRILLIEYRIDSGNWISILPPVDGFYDEPTEEGEVDLEFDTSGTFSVCARATDDFNNTGNPACVDVDVEGSLRLRAIEVNQVIQDWRNTVPLYQKKDTVVRVFVERIEDTGPTLFRGSLYGSRDGAPLPGSPLQPDSAQFAFVAEDASAFSVTETSVDSWRQKIRNSVNFTLPPTWIDSGSPVDLEFQLTSPLNQVVSCAEPDGNPDCTVTVQFELSVRPLVHMFAVPYDRNEILELVINASGGTFRFTSGGGQSDPVPYDASPEVIEDAVEDAIGGILDARDGRVVVGCLDCQSPTRWLQVTILRGQDEELQVDASGLVGSAQTIEIQKGGSSIEPTYDQLREQARRITDMFPTWATDYAMFDLNDYNKAPTLLKVNTRLAKAGAAQRILGTFRPGSRRFGLLMQRGPTSTKSGMAWLKESSTYAGPAPDPEDGGTRRSTGVHEGAHTYGRAHAVMDDQGPLGSRGICGSKYNDAASPFHPFIEDTGLRNSGAVEEAWRFWWPTLGPLSNGADEEVWGFSPRAYANGSDFSHLMIVDPRRSAELMSYCDAPGSGQDRWVSTFTYGILADRINRPGSRDVPNEPGAGTGEYLIVSGEIDETEGEVFFEPSLRLTGDDPGFEPGDLHVALVDGLGSEITSRDVVVLVDGDHGSLAEGTEPEHPAFVAAIPIPDGSTPAGVTVTLDNQLLGEINASPNPPTVALVSPPSSGMGVETIPIVWDADDLDGDTLTASLFYSTDLGLTWEPLALDVEGTTYDAPTRFLRGSTGALVRVFVSDGFHVAEATSLPFAIDARKPSTSIGVPARGVAIALEQTLRLRGDAWDPEDGELDGSSLSWTAAPVDLAGAASNGEQVLGSGEALDIPANQLAAGCHIVTLTATDSDGKTGTDTAEVDIGETGCLGLFFEDGFESGDLSAWSGSLP